VRAGTTIISNDVGIDPRWPKWGIQAAGLGVKHVLALHLYTSGAVFGALNLYRSNGEPYTGSEVELARAVGSLASLVLARYRNDQNLWRDNRYTLELNSRL
jgi:GAF domain-containing protein